MMALIVTTSAIMQAHPLNQKFTETPPSILPLKRGSHEAVNHITGVNIPARDNSKIIDACGPRAIVVAGRHVGPWRIKRRKYAFGRSYVAMMRVAGIHIHGGYRSLGIQASDRVPDCRRVIEPRALI